MLPRNESTGLLLVGHGTRSDVGTRQFLALADSLARGLAPLPVEPAFLELQQPDIDAAVERLVDRGVHRLVTMPLLLFAAGHAKRDIPDAVKAALTVRGLGHIEQVQAVHLGCHLALVELSNRRMADAVADNEPVNPTDSCLLIVGRGSHDESATAEMHEFARFRQQGLQGMRTAVAFLAMARPLLQEQLSRVACQVGRRVIVQPHLLFQGELVESIERQVAEMAARHAEKQWIVTQPLADLPDFVTSATELVQKVILDRCVEAWIRVAALRRGD